jgi:hypothetical protein
MHSCDGLDKSLTVLCSLLCTDNGKPKFEKAEKGAHAAVEPSSPKKTTTLSSQPSATKAEKRVSGSYSGGSLQDVFDDFCSFGAGSGGKVRQTPSSGSVDFTFGRG